ncbi:hypothetical protein H072_6688 [Dactylellina haptotyla CBS 200.50]|uniref:CBM1 domain-containing protein n=1 Tax=Dactylellina haptotyla (strain CBS 200.50) TaxID=1284197 RepID=S8A8Y2_DACHA|nr:hypothetical protein H072_6688 [Dactylellina haptotyla CBS 200.50]
MLLVGAFLIAGLLFTPATAQVSPPAKADGYTTAFPIDISQVSLSSSRWGDNQSRTLAYIKYIDVQRLLYVFRNNHKLSVNGAAKNGGWDDPTFPFRSHVQGHFLTAWAQCYATLKDSTCKSQAQTMTAALVQCQNNNGAAGFSSGYLSGFPESDFNALEAGTLTNGNVPYYVIHKTLAGLLDVWRNIGDTNAKTACLALAAWVDTRTAKLTSSKMQSVLGTEFGGMMEVMTDIYFQSGDSKWLTTAARFYHTSVEDPLSNNQDNLNGLHANTQVPKWIGAIRNYKATGNTKYLAIAKNAWNIVVNAHTYAIGGNSQAEHFRPANAISGYLTTDTCEHCNSYNMLKLARELWSVEPTNSAYFDYYERTLFNHIIAAQNPNDSHGHITYFTSLNPGAKRGLGPAWGGGTWSTDYSSFWCCQGTGVESNTKLMDSVYWYDSSSLYINMFMSSVLNWSAKGITITQTTTYPITDSTTLTVSGSGSFSLKVRIPSWTFGASILINGASAGVSVSAGSYATISRTWSSGDTIKITLPMKFRTVAANDNSGIAAIAYGPVVLTANNGATTRPTLDLSSLMRTSTSSLTFSGKVNGATTTFVAFYEGQSGNMNTYFTITGSLPVVTTTTTTSTTTGMSRTTTATSMGTTSTSSRTTTTTTKTTTAGGTCATLYGQCGGINWTGPTCCTSSTCTFGNDYYSQCL